MRNPTRRASIKPRPIQTLLATVMSTNPVESMIDTLRAHARNVKQLATGRNAHSLGHRWLAGSGKAAPSRQGYSQLPQLVTATKNATSNTGDDAVFVTPAG